MFDDKFARFFMRLGTASQSEARQYIRASFTFGRVSIHVLDQPEHDCRNMVNASLKDASLWEMSRVAVLERLPLTPSLPVT
jgi:hypothetical protein